MTLEYKFSLSQILILNFYLNNIFRIIESGYIVLQTGVRFDSYQRYFVYLQTKFRYLRIGTKHIVYFMPEYIYNINLFKVE